MLGDNARAKEWAERAVLIDPDNISMRYNLACGLAYLGDLGSVNDMLTPYFASVSLTQLHHCAIDPDLDAMRGDARFQKMIDDALARLGQPRSVLPGEGRLLSSEAAELIARN